MHSHRLHYTITAGTKPLFSREIHEISSNLTKKKGAFFPAAEKKPAGQGTGNEGNARPPGFSSYKIKNILFFLSKILDKIKSMLYNAAVLREPDRPPGPGEENKELR
ncbi:MAG: hypothetical protein IKS46_07540 [Clostridia bacterium]|nr:hypothetical protein [Clostridia bacterium]